MGTPTYMAPEQIRSTASADARSDQWSLGVVLYELLAGAPPFMAPSVGELCATILEQTPARIDEIHPEVPAGLADVIARCLEKGPDARHRDVAALAEALLPWGPTRAVAPAERAARILSGVVSGNGLSRKTPPAIAVSASVASRTAAAAPPRSMPRTLLALAGTAVIAAAVVATFARTPMLAESRVTLAHAADPPPAANATTTIDTALAVDTFHVGATSAPPTRTIAAAPNAPVARRPAASTHAATPPTAATNTATSVPPPPPSSVPSWSTSKVELGY